MQDSVTDPAAIARTHASSPATLRTAFKMYIRAFQRIQPQSLPSELMILPSMTMDPTMWSYFSCASLAFSVHARSYSQR